MSLTSSSTSKLVVISGIRSEIGMRTGALYLKHGYKVCGLSRTDLSTLDISDYDIPIFKCDVGSFESCNNAIMSILSSTPCQSVWGLVNCAGVTSNKLFLRSNISDDFQEMYNINVIGSMNLTKAVLKNGRMLHSKDGSVVYVGSVAGERGNIGQSAYAASKAALVGASRSLAREYGGSNLRFNVLQPGLISGTGMCDKLDEAQKAKFTERCSLRRLGTTEEVAQAIYMLTQCSYINGQVINVDGGTL